MSILIPKKISLNVTILGTKRLTFIKYMGRYDRVQKKYIYHNFASFRNDCMALAVSVDCIKASLWLP